MGAYLALIHITHLTPHPYTSPTPQVGAGSVRVPSPTHLTSTAHPYTSPTPQVGAGSVRVPRRRSADATSTDLDEACGSVRRAVALSRCVGPPGNAVSIPVRTHIQAHQPPLLLDAQVRPWPAWKCVNDPCVGSYPGTPTPARRHFAQVRRWPAWKCVLRVADHSLPGTSTLYVHSNARKGPQVRWSAWM